MHACIHTYTHVEDVLLCCPCVADLRSARLVLVPLPARPSLAWGGAMSERVLPERDFYVTHSSTAWGVLHSAACGAACSANQRASWSLRLSAGKPCASRVPFLLPWHRIGELLYLGCVGFARRLCFWYDDRRLIHDFEIPLRKIQALFGKVAIISNGLATNTPEHMYIKRTF